MAAIGIDLGTTNCCVAAVLPSGVEVITNRLGKRTTPSAIAFFRDNIHYGTDALDLFSRCPNNVIHGLKYLIGRDFTEINQYIDKMSYTIVDNNKRIGVVISEKNKKSRSFQIEELTALLLTRLKEDAETKLDQNVETAVITVPTYFADSSRQATIDAAKIAGFKNVQLLNEPTAAAIAYGEKFVDKKTILVFDFGGGTFDISVMCVNKDECSVLAIDGDLHLGGDNIDNNIIDYIKSKNSNLFTGSLLRNGRTMYRLKRKCEIAKQKLSTSAEAFIEIMEIVPGEDLSIELSIEEFNEINKRVFEECMRIMKNCLDRTHLKKNNIDAVLLVGGSTRNQEIKKLLIEYMGAEKLKEDTNPDEVVAIGAAIMAATKVGKLRETKVNQISAHSLGICLAPNDRFSCLIPKFSKVPIRKSGLFMTYPRGSPNGGIYIYAGECENAKENKWLGEFVIENVHESPNGTRDYTIIFELDSNGILQVCADDNHGGTKHATITLDKGNLSIGEINDLSQKIQNMQLQVHKPKKIYK